MLNALPKRLRPFRDHPSPALYDRENTRIHQKYAPQTVALVMMKAGWKQSQKADVKIGRKEIQKFYSIPTNAGRHILFLFHGKIFPIL